MNECPLIVEELELHSGEVPIDAVKASQLWRSQYDVNIVANVDEVGVDVEHVVVHA